ncbi:MAG: RNA polymerase sigma factor [Myxococcota bacterium]
MPDDPVARAATGDAAAQADLYRVHAATLTRRLTHVCGDAELARDVAQDAFITAFDRLGRFRGRSSFSTWLHGIAFNHLRDRRKHRRREASGQRRLAQVSADAAPSVEGAVASRRAVEKLDEVLGTLAPKLRDAFVLRVVEQLSLEEAASILGARQATVSYRAKRAEALVRKAFEGKDESR